MTYGFTLLLRQTNEYFWHILYVVFTGQNIELKLPLILQNVYLRRLPLICIRCLFFQLKIFIQITKHCESTCIILDSFWREKCKIKKENRGVYKNNLKFRFPKHATRTIYRTEKEIFLLNYTYSIICGLMYK